MINKQDLIIYLETEIRKLEIDNYNQATREWSKGYIKGALFLLQKIKEWEDI